MRFRYILLAELGTPQRSFDWDDALLILAAIAIAIGLQWGLEQAIRRWAGVFRERIATAMSLRK